MRAKEFARHIFEQVKSNWYIPVTEHQVYSTAEQKVGVWTDGKPLYRKVIPVTLPQSSGSIQTGMSGLEYIKVAAFEMYFSNGYWGNISYAGWSVVIKNGGSDAYITVGTNDYAKGQPGRLILEYTKTTDTATSPKVPYEPLHEWSTEEKLVGYWIDGKAVYEKTVDCGTLPNKGTKNVAHGINNIDKIIKSEGYGTNGSETVVISAFRDTTDGKLTWGISCFIDRTNIVLLSNTFDFSTYTESYITLRYTKTTD